MSYLKIMIYLKNNKFPNLFRKVHFGESPHSLVHFTKELAANYHSFYEQNSVITDNQEESNARL